MVKVSAIVVTHNRVKELSRAIESVCGQTYADIELIVVNDGSDDGTKDYLDRLEADGVCQAINLDTSGGAARARNLGVAASMGELVAFLDDDDVWHRTKIAEQVPLFAASANIGAVYCAMRMVFDGAKYVATKPNEKYRGFIGNDIFTTMLATSSAMMYTRAAFDAVGGFDENLTHWQDVELNIRVGESYAVDFVPRPLVDVFASTASSARLSNQYDAWLKAVAYIRYKHADEIRRLTPQQKTKFDRMCAEDELTRLYNSSQRAMWWRKSLSYFTRHPTPGRLLQLVTVHDQLWLWKPLLPSYSRPA